MDLIYLFSNEFHRVVKVLFLSLSIFSIAISDIITKDNNNTSLDQGSSWVGGVAPGAGDIALWDNTITGSNIVTTGSDRYYLGIRITDPAGDITISNNTISLGTSGIDMSSSTANLSILSGITLGSSQTWGINSGKQIWHDGVINGGGNLVISGDGTLFLNGNNTFTGALIINNGRLEITNNNSLGATGSGTTVNSGGSLALNGASGNISLAAEPLTINGDGDGLWGALVNDGGTNSIPGTVTMSGNSVINTEDGHLTINGVLSGGYSLTKAGSDTLVLSAANTYTGLTYLINGVLVMAHDSALGTIESETVVDSGAELQIEGPLDSIFEPLVLNGSGINGNGALLTSGAGTIYHRGTINLASASTIGNNNGYSLYLEGVISGSGDLTTKGGWIRLRETNTYTGVTTVEPGLLQVLDDNSLGSTDNGTVVNDGATLYLGGVTLPAGETITLKGDGYDLRGKLYTNYNSNTINGDIFIYDNSDINVADSDDYITINGIVGGSGNLIKDGDGVLILTASNTYSGVTYIDSGIVQVDSDTALGSTTNGTVVASGSQLIINDINYRSPEPLTLNGAGIDNKGALTAPCNSFTFYSGDITVASDAAIGTPSSPYSLILDGQISGSGNLSIVDSAYIQLEGDNSGFTGTLTIGGDMTRAGHDNALGATSAGTIVSSGSTLAFRDHTFAAEPITIYGDGYNDIGALYTKNASPELTGPVTLGSDSRIGVSQDSDILTISGVISGGFDLYKSGDGTLVLSGDNTHSSTMSVSGGAVYLNGINAFQTSITVSEGATLGGIGSTNANITLIDSATLDPGYGSVASFSTGAITMSNICSLNVDIGTNNDTVVVNGELVLDGVLNISNGEGFGPGTYTIMTYTGNLSDNGLTIGRAPDTYNYTINASAGEVSLVVTSAGAGSSIVKANNTTDLNIGSSWVGGVVPGANDTAVWDNTVTADSATASLGENTKWKQIKILDPGTTVHIKNDTLTIGLGGVDMSSAESWLALDGTINIETNQEWNIEGPRRVTCNGPLIGSYSITKTGTGYLRLADDNNTFTGGLTISEGILQIGKNEAAGTLPVDVTNNGQILFAKTADYEYSGIISGTGTLVQGDTGTITLSGSNTYSGLTTITTGALEVKNASALGDVSSGTVVDNGASLLIGDTINILEPLTLNGAGVSNGGALVNLDGETQYDGPISLSSASTISNMSNNYFYLDGTISGDGDLTFAGTSAIVIREDNTYTGITTVNNDRLWLMEDIALGDSLSATIVLPDASIYLISSINVPESFGISGAGDDSAGVIKSYRDTNSISGNVTLNEASIISVREDVLTISGNVNGAYTFEKIGDAPLVLSGDNSHSADILLSAGSLFINGTNDSQTTITLSENTLLGGTGSTVASVTMVDGSILEPGYKSIAKFTTGSIIMTDSSSFNIDIGSSNDTVVVGGDLTLDGILNIDSVDSFTPGIYTIMTYSGSITDNELSIGTTPDDSLDYSISIEDNRVDLIIASENKVPQVVLSIPDIVTNEDAKDTILANLKTVFLDTEDSVNLDFSIVGGSNKLISTAIDSFGFPWISFVENAHGSTNVVISATDSKNSTAYDTIQVIVNSVNDAPVLHSVTPWAMEDGLPVTLTLSQIYATDVDGDDLKIVIDTGSNYTVDSLTITPTIGFIGFLDIPISVTDDIDTSNQLTVKVEVKQAGKNRPPILNAADIPPIGKNGALRVTVDMLDAYDPDGDSLTIFIFEGDDFVAQGTMIIPNKGFTGYLQVPIKVTDGIGLSSEVMAEVSVFEKVIDFYKGQIISSDTYEAAIGPNPLPPDADRLEFRATLNRADVLEITVFDAIGNIVHKGETDEFGGKFYYSWDISFSERIRGRAYLVLLTYYRDGEVIKRDKKMIGVAK